MSARTPTSLSAEFIGSFISQSAVARNLRPIDPGHLRLGSLGPKAIDLKVQPAALRRELPLLLLQRLEQLVRARLEHACSPDELDSPVKLPSFPGDGRLLLLELEKTFDDVGVALPLAHLT